MDDRRAHSQENLLRPESARGPDSSPRGVKIYNNCTVNNVERVENAYFGDNLGTINGGSDSSQPAASSQFVSNTELDALLAPIPNASYTRNRKTSPPDSDCFPGTREDIIEGITDWADSPVLFNADTPHVYWTHGYVGCGKSSISQAVSKKYGQNGRLLASFFFYRNSGDRSKMTKFAVTLACQMVAAIPSTRSFVQAAVKLQPALLTREVSLATQLEHLVYKPFTDAVKWGLIFYTLFYGPFLIVIDGLDECEDKDEVKEFIEHLLDFFKRHPSTPLRVFITSRVEQHIKECLNVTGVRLDDLVAHGSDDDILTFLEASFLLRAERDPVIAAYVQSHGKWPTRPDTKTLVHHIGGSFIFASALFKYIVAPSDDGLTPMTRLPLTLNLNPGLDGLYAYTVAKSQRLPHFSDVISTIALLFKPLPITGIAELLGIETFEVLHILVNLQAIIHIPGTDDLPVTFCHTSLRDFLTTENRSGRFFASPSHHIHLACRCFLLKDKQHATAAAQYSNRWEEHLEHFTRLSPNTPGPLPRLPQILDVLYIQILAKSQNLPCFSGIISTLALLYEPLPISGIAELLEIEAHEVSQVMGNLRAIIHLPCDTSPVSFCHTSLRDFLTTESRSGHFFAPPSHHLHLFYRCLALRDEQQLETAATVYSVGHLMKHLSCLPSSEQERLTPTLSPLPQTLDAFFIHILAKVQHLPHFSDIMSIIASINKPHTIIGVAELLGIEVSKVSRVLAGLEAIIDSPGFDEDKLVTVLHTSLREFLTTKTRSGTFFVPPSYPLRLSYHYFKLNIQDVLNGTQLSSVARNWRQCCQERWNEFLVATPEQGILAELEELPHLPNQNLPYHLFSFVQVFFWLFEDDSDHRPQQIWYALAKCIESLALALECDSAPNRWLKKTFKLLVFDSDISLWRKQVYHSKIHQHQATTLKRDVRRIEQAIRKKCYHDLSGNLSIFRNNRFTSTWWLWEWTPMEACTLFQWIDTRVQTEMRLSATGVSCDLVLTIARQDRYRLDYMEILSKATT